MWCTSTAFGFLCEKTEITCACLQQKTIAFFVDFICCLKELKMVPRNLVKVHTLNVRYTDLGKFLDIFIFLIIRKMHEGL